MADQQLVEGFSRMRGLLASLGEALASAQELNGPAEPIASAVFLTTELGAQIDTLEEAARGCTIPKAAANDDREAAR